MEQYKIVSTRYLRVNPYALLGKYSLGERVMDGQPPEETLAVYYRHSKEFNTFTPFGTGGKTVVVVENLENGERATGVAICSMQDQFNYAKGREIAFSRAVELLKG